MSLVPSSSDQMGPGGGWNFGSPPVRYTTKQVGIIPDVTIEEVGHFLITAGIGLVVGNPVVSVGMGLVHWNYHILNPLVSDVYAELTGSTGGGGPGELPNLHRPPPSIEETGEILSYPGFAVEVPSSPRRSTSKKAGKRRKCPKGWHWSKHYNTCVRTAGFWKG